MKPKHFFGLSISLLFILLAVSPALAESEVEVCDLTSIALPIHIVELVLAFAAGYMALKFFRITKPLNLFLLVYVMMGFFIISSLIYILFYISEDFFGLNLNFTSVYMGSRIALVAMLISLTYLFFYMYNTMKSKDKENKKK